MQLMVDGADGWLENAVRVVVVEYKALSENVIIQDLYVVANIVKVTAILLSQGDAMITTVPVR